MAKDYRGKYVQFVQGQAGALINPGSYFGTVFVGSRDTFVTAAAVTSGTQVTLTTPRIWGTSSLGVAPVFAISSVVAGTGFAITTIASFGLGTSSISVGWQITQVP